MLFGTPSKLPDGRYFLKVSQDDQSRVMHQVNNVILAPSEQDSSVTVQQITQTALFSEVDDQIMTQAKASKQAWFGKDLSDETVVSAYQKSLSADNELLASFVTIKGKNVSTFYDAQKNMLETVQAHVPVDVLLELTGLMFTKRVFEPVWKVVQARRKAPPPKQKFPREYLFTDDPTPADDDDDDEPDL